MIAFTNILCPVDFSDTSARALAYAAAFAAWYEAPLTVLHVVRTFDVDLSGAMGEGSRLRYPVAHDEVIAELRRVVEPVATGLRLTLLAEEGHASDTIAARAAALSADLLVLGTHGRGGFSRLLLGSVAEKLLRAAHCPVLTVPPAAPVATPGPIAFTNILCPIDFSPSSVKALAFALDLGRQAGGRVTVLHAVEHMETEEPCEHVDVHIRDTRRRIIDRAREQLHAQLAPEQRSWCDIEEIVAVNRAYREILQRAATADLIVMGAQGHGGVDLMLYGSNTQHVVRGALCPVLTVHA